MMTGLINPFPLPLIGASGFQAPLYKWLDQVGVSLDKDIGQLGNEEITSLVGVLPMEQGLPMTRQPPPLTPFTPCSPF